MNGTATELVSTAPATAAEPVAPAPWGPLPLTGWSDSLLRAGFAAAAVSMSLSPTAHPFAVSVGRAGRVAYFGTPEEVRQLMEADLPCEPADDPASPDFAPHIDAHGERSPFLLVEEAEPFHWSNNLPADALLGKAWLHVGKVAFGSVSSSVLGSWEASYDLHLGHGCTVRRRFASQQEAREFVEHQAVGSDHDIREQIRTLLWDRRKRRDARPTTA